MVVRTTVATRTSGADASRAEIALEGHESIQFPQAVVLRESGEPSIPETSVIEPIRRGVLGPPLSRRMTSVGGANPCDKLNASYAEIAFAESTWLRKMNF